MRPWTGSGSCSASRSRSRRAAPSRRSPRLSPPRRRLRLPPPPPPRQASLDKALKLEPNHAEAHIALGAYHAEIVSTVGGMLASLTYGASKEEAMKHLALSRRLLPDSAIARIEEANGLVRLFGKAKLAEAEKLYEEAARCKPADAMQKLDAEHAREEADG